MLLSSITQAVAHWWSPPTSAHGPQKGWKELKPISSPPPHGASGRYRAVPQGARFTRPLWHQKIAEKETTPWFCWFFWLVVHISADRHRHPGTGGCSGAGTGPPPLQPLPQLQSSHCIVSTSPPERKNGKRKNNKRKQLEQLPVANNCAPICHSQLQHSGPSRFLILLDSVIGCRGKEGLMPTSEDGAPRSHMRVIVRSAISCVISRPARTSSYLQCLQRRV